jgi:polyisoprenoid-binding protein YceI
MLALVAPQATAGQTATWQVSRADVRVVCPLTVGGSFEAETSALAGALPPAGSSLTGELSVDLPSLDTGIGLRNDHLRDTYLEVGRGPAFATAHLGEIRVAAPDLSAFRGRTTFTGSLSLHGATKPVAGTVEVEAEGRVAHVKASFPILLTDFGIAQPRYLGVGVTDAIRVNVRLTANLQGDR